MAQAEAVACENRPTGRRHFSPASGGPPASGGGPPLSRHAIPPHQQWRPCLYNITVESLKGFGRTVCSRWQRPAQLIASQPYANHAHSQGPTHQAASSPQLAWPCFTPTGRPQQDEWQPPGAEVRQVVLQRIHVAAAEPSIKEWLLRINWNASARGRLTGRASAHPRCCEQSQQAQTVRHDGELLLTAAAHEQKADRTGGGCLAGATDARHPGCARSIPHRCCGCAVGGSTTG